MKLNKRNIARIKKHLNFKGLTLVDQKNGVLDNMMASIENCMMYQKVNFSKVFEKEIHIWKSETEACSSFWLGWYW